MRDADVKAEFRKHASLDPKEHYPVDTLKELGLSRYQCSKCSRYFWSLEEQKVCGDAACSGGFRFIGHPSKKPLEYIEVWKEFSRIHKKLGYTPVTRYPVIARWNPTTDFTIASIAAFQPYVVSGEVTPPANPLVIPQLSIRFPDIDNVGITGHFVAFVMLGQHAFVPPEKYDVNQYMQDHLTWLQDGMGLPLKEITIHEDAWAGGGNLGPSVEFFSKGLEISNQVYMQYEIENGSWKDLNIKVLDMGQGMERAAWFTQGGASMYECIFPSVIKKLRSKTGHKYDEAFMKKFTPLASYLNIDEVEDINAAWKHVADKLKMDVSELRAKVQPTAALYSIAEHSRALLAAISDGALPSNVGGMYNLRVILRRALGFIDQYGWDIELPDVCAEHAKYLKPLFPELSENLDHVQEILGVEKKKYKATRKKTEKLLPRILDQDLSDDKLVELYDSQGISPEMLKQAAQAADKQVSIPENFYALLADRHEQEAQAHQTQREEKLNLDDFAETKALYFDDYQKVTFDAKVVGFIGNNVLLEETAFYPTSGGQLADSGTLNGQKVVDVFKQGKHIVHVLEDKPKFHAGDKVHGEIDFNRRIQLAQHHTATHIVNAAAKKVLGRHVNQASAKKDVDKAHIDLTHYDALSDEEVQKIEDEANKIVKQGIDTSLTFMPREEAEKEYGMEIYQGGAVPGKQLRIVKIGEVDVEACGGTHLQNTSETGKIKILKASKVKDGVVRLTFAAGNAANTAAKQEQDVLGKAASLMHCNIDQVPARAEELFKLWKKARKAAKKKEPFSDTTLKSTESFEGDILAKTAEVLQTQPDHVVKTIERFLADVEKAK